MGHLQQRASPDGFLRPSGIMNDFRQGRRFTVYEKIIKMRSKTNRKIISLTAGIIVCGLGFAGIFPYTVYADINSNESRVISAASGTFVYNGDYYNATEDSLRQLHSKLDAPDVDMSSADADKYISTGYASVADGVAQGYLVKIQSGNEDTGAVNPGDGDAGTETENPGTGTGGTTNPGTGTGGKTNPGAGTGSAGKKAGNSGESKTPASETGTETKAEAGDKGTAADTADKGSAVNSSTASAENTVLAQTVKDPEREALLDELTGLTSGQRDAIVNDYAERYSAELNKGKNNTGTDVRKKLATGEDAILEDGSTTIWNDIAEQDFAEGIDTGALNKRAAEADAKSSIIFDSNDNSISLVVNGGEKQRKDITELIPVNKIRNIMYLVSGTALLCVLICAALLYMSGSLSAQHSRDIAEHKKKKKTKNICRFILSAAIAASLSTAAVSALGYIWIFSVSGEVETINRSGFYQYSYGTMKAKAENMLMLASLDEHIIDNELDYNRFQLLSKQTVRGVLTGKTEGVVPESLKGDVTKALKAKAGLSETVLTTLVDELVSVYSALLKNSVIEYLTQLKKDFMPPVVITVIMSLITVFLGVMLFFKTEGNAAGAMRPLMVSTGAAALLVLAAFVINKTSGPLNGMYISPEYLYILAEGENGRLNSALVTSFVLLAVMVPGEFGVSRINNRKDGD